MAKRTAAKPAAKPKARKLAPKKAAAAARKPAKTIRKAKAGVNKPAPKRAQKPKAPATEAPKVPEAPKPAPAKKKAPAMRGLGGLYYCVLTKQPVLPGAKGQAWDEFVKEQKRKAKAHPGPVRSKPVGCYCGYDDYREVIRGKGRFVAEFCEEMGEWMVHPRFF